MKHKEIEIKANTKVKKILTATTEPLEIKPVSEIPGTKRMDGSVCKYSKQSFWRDRCSDYMTLWCLKCRHYYLNQAEEEVLSKDGYKSYYECIGGL